MDPYKNTRGEPLTDRVATIIQAGHRDQKTSEQVASEVLDLVANALGLERWRK